MSAITRPNASALIPEVAQREIAQNVATQSIFMRMARRLPNMSTNQTRMPVLSTLPSAYWVNGDTGLKQTSKSEWSNVYIKAEELAVIVPIPEAVLDDANYNIWAEVAPSVSEAFGQAVDLAALYGVDRPSSWPTGLVTQAVAASNDVDLSSHIGAGGGNDIYSALLGESGVFTKVEADGYAVNGMAALLSMKAKLRGLRDTTGQPIFKGGDVQGVTNYTVDGVPLMFQENLEEADATALAIAGDWRKVVWSMRQDITMKVLDQAVIQDNAGNILYNLAKQDMVAARFVMRLGWALPNPANRVNTNAATRCPFGVLVA